MIENTVTKGEKAPAKIPAEGQARGAYETPRMFLIGAAGELLCGSGRHKNDDTGSRGFTVG